MNTSKPSPFKTHYPSALKRAELTALNERRMRSETDPKSPVVGVALSGGSGTVLGTVLGALVIQFLESGLLLLDVDIGWRMVIVGQVLIAAVVFDVLYRRATGERVA